ncbi:GlsB/YeaQ/YmgE family stress response membrane protein [Rubellimicrobium roseum]|uniref:GlsB/YeaQ/YmgE family stress response membrane protein n=1 Tax=Rubellimicrobium roseum TaxID=687525 RepID=A0A5C4ND13_9RHOB|nr:GlsB/YeaQ/YmgE family stress response membrane protein [Rubellimicrobium roseum]TNC71972.1 GlsB/YeaQ/YmgE family stress response membrane protein [Rubellimicrobium roseum]
MEGLGWLSFLIIGLIAGWIAEKIMHRDQGLLVNLIVGVIGAYLGAFLFSLVGLETAGSWIGAIIVATIGAVVLLWIVGMIRRRA